MQKRHPMLCFLNLSVEGFFLTHPAVQSRDSVVRDYIRVGGARIIGDFKVKNFTGTYNCERSEAIPVFLTSQQTNIPKELENTNAWIASSHSPLRLTLRTRSSQLYAGCTDLSTGVS